MMGGWMDGCLALVIRKSSGVWWHIVAIALRSSFVKAAVFGGILWRSSMHKIHGLQHGMLDEGQRLKICVE